MFLSTLPAVGLSRCAGCGERRTSLLPFRRLCVCLRCCLPFLGDAGTTGREDLCSECRPSDGPIPLPEAGVVAATEAELRAALSVRWGYVGTETLCAYVDRIARQVGRSLGCEARAVPFGRGTMLSLTLPSGAVLISVGTLSRLSDEAELAFVLAHELAHVVSGDASAILVRTCLRSLARDDPRDDAWADAATDLVKVGYGDGRECDADERAFDAVVALGYDPRSVFALLGRLDAWTLAGEPDVAELALAHPPAAERRRRLQDRHSRRTGDAPERRCRVEREVFRRAAGHSVLSAGLERVQPFVETTEREPGPTGRGLAYWTAAAIILLALVFLVVGVLLSG